jgi:inhibitor of growth protein 3
VSAPDPSPPKRKRVTREEDDILPQRTPRKEKAVDAAARPRNGGRAKKNERGASPTESLLSVTSHIPTHATNGSSRVGATANGSRGGGNNPAPPPNKRSRPSTNHVTAHSTSSDPSARLEHHANNAANGNPRREIFNAPPSSSSSHPSLPLPYGAGAGNLHSYDLPHHPVAAGDWLPPHQLEGPGMPVARGQSAHPVVLASSVAHASMPAPAAVSAGADTPADGGDGEGEGDDKTYCFCDGISYGEMIACDDAGCEREWFHLACIGLTVPPDGTWFCETCRAKRNAKRGGRGGKRRAGGARSGGKAATGA